MTPAPGRLPPRPRKLPRPKPAIEVARVAGEAPEGVEQPGLEGPRAVGLPRGGLPGAPEVREGRGHGLRPASGPGGEAGDHRRRGAPEPHDAPHQGVPVLDGEGVPSVAHVIRLARGGYRRTQGAGRQDHGLPRVAREALDAPHLGGEPREGGHLAGVAADHRDVELREEAPCRLRAHGGRPGAHRVEHHGDAALVRPAAGEEHGLDLVPVQRAYVQDEGRGEGGHLLDLLARVGHYRERARGEGGVRHQVHRHVVGYVVDERALLAELAQECSGTHASTSFRTGPRACTGPAPAPISENPYRTASEATSRALLAASGRSNPSARKLASEAEWVQPAPWVFSERWTGPSILSNLRPS